MMTDYLSKIITNGYFLLFVFLFTLRNFVEIIIQQRKKKTSKSERKGNISLLASSVFFLISGFAAGFFLLIHENINSSLYGMGLIVFILAYIGRLRALQSLGDNYSLYIEIRPEHKLVVSGIYSVLRHPLYSLYLVEMIAFVMIKWNYVSLIAIFPVILGIIRRIEEEERILADVFGKQFEVYRNTTKKLIPFIY
jgi:protein-S-isoprenylcysteine O-methyltransferase Ste14